MRRSAVVAVVVASVAACGAASASAAPLAFIGNRDSNQVSVLNTATNELVGGQLEVGEGPASVAITPDGRTVFVADALDGTVSVIGTSPRITVGKPIAVGGLLFGLAVTPDGSRVFVTDRSGSRVSVIDTATRQVIARVQLPLASSPAGVAVSPDGRFAYVTESGANAVVVIDTESMTLVGKPIEVGEEPLGIEFTPDGKTAYVADRGSDEVTAIDTATRKVTSIALAGGEQPRGIVVAPDGREAFVVDPASDSVSVIDTATNEVSGEIEVGSEPQEVALAAGGKTVYVTEAGPPPEGVAQVERIDVASGKVLGPPIAIPGEFPSGIAITPDQSPTAAFAVPDITAGMPATFSGAGSSDPDGSIASYSWTFGDGGVASGVRPTHTYAAPGTYDAKLSVLDEEGCGEEEVFTGRTAYCSGGAASVTHRVTVKPAPVPPILTAPSNRFHIGRVIHNRRNGTVRMQVKLPDAGFVLLFGRKVHAVTRKSKGVQAMWLTIHPRVELNKRLKRIHRARVGVRVTFTPNGGTARSRHRAVTLLRARRKKQHRHHR